MTAANDLAVCRALKFAGVEFIDENGGGPVDGYAKRPRERAANRLSRPDTQLAKRSNFLLLLLDSRLGLGVHRRKRRRPGRAFEKDSKRKRPQVTLRQPIRRNKAKFLNDCMEGGVPRKNWLRSPAQAGVQTAKDGLANVAQDSPYGVRTSVGRLCAGMSGV